MRSDSHNTKLFLSYTQSTSVYTENSVCFYWDIIQNRKYCFVLARSLYAFRRHRGRPVPHRFCVFHLGTKATIELVLKFYVELTCPSHSFHPTAVKTWFNFICLFRNYKTDQFPTLYLLHFPLHLSGRLDTACETVKYSMICLTRNKCI